MSVPVHFALLEPEYPVESAENLRIFVHLVFTTMLLLEYDDMVLVVWRENDLIWSEGQQQMPKTQKENG